MRWSLGGSECAAGDTYPQRLRHSLPSSMALQDEKSEKTDVKILEHKA